MKMEKVELCMVLQRTMWTDIWIPSPSLLYASYLNFESEQVK